MKSYQVIFMVALLTLAGCGGDSGGSDGGSSSANTDGVHSFELKKIPTPSTIIMPEINPTKGMFRDTKNGLYITVTDGANDKEYAAKIVDGQYQWSQLHEYDQIESLWAPFREADDSFNALVLGTKQPDDEFSLFKGGDEIWSSEGLFLTIATEGGNATQLTKSDDAEIILSTVRNDYTVVGHNSISELEQSRNRDTFFTTDMIATANYAFIYSNNYIRNLTTGESWDFSEYGIINIVLADDEYDELWALVGSKIYHFNGNTWYFHQSLPETTKDGIPVMINPATMMAQDDWYLYLPAGVAIAKQDGQICDYLAGIKESDIETFMMRNAFNSSGVMGAGFFALYTLMLEPSGDTHIVALSTHPAGISSSLKCD